MCSMQCICKAHAYIHDHGRIMSMLILALIIDAKKKT